MSGKSLQLFKRSVPPFAGSPFRRFFCLETVKLLHTILLLAMLAWLCEAANTACDGRETYEACNRLGEPISLTVGLLLQTQAVFHEETILHILG